MDVNSRICTDFIHSTMVYEIGIAISHFGAIQEVISCATAQQSH